MFEEHTQRPRWRTAGKSSDHAGRAARRTHLEKIGKLAMLRAQGKLLPERNKVVDGTGGPG